MLDLMVGATILLAAVGVVVPIIPGVVLAVAALFVWALLTASSGAWWLFAAAVAVILVGQFGKYLLPGRRMAAAGIPGRSLVVGGLAGIVGFFAIPLVGLPLGFVAGIYLAEHLRLQEWTSARHSTWVALRATGLSMLIELASVLLAGALWLSRVLVA